MHTIADVDSVTIASLALAAPAQAALNPATGHWHASITPNPEPGATEVALTATVTSHGSQHAHTRHIPVVAASATLTATIVDVAPQSIATLPYGDGPDEIGFWTPPGDGLVIVPMAVDVDPRDGAIAVLDNANERVVVLSPDGATRHVVDLPPEGALNDITVNGDTGYATVSQFAIADGHQTTTVFQIDLDTGTYTQTGPAQPPIDPPGGLDMVWNPADHTVYAKFFWTEPLRGFFPYYETDQGSFVMSDVADQWYEHVVNADWSQPVESIDQSAGLGYTYNDVAVTVDLPGIEEPTDTVVAEDGTIWFTTGTIDPTMPSGPDRVHYYLVRLDPGCGTATAVELPRQTFRYAATRTFALLGDNAYFPQITPDAYVLETYELPDTSCAS